MITKERLQQLIEQGATIYGISKKPFIAGYSSILEVNPINLSIIQFNDKENKIEDYDTTTLCTITYNLEDLFETELDAKWDLEMTATRTETLKMPTWEDMTTENNEYNYYGSSDIHYFCFDNYRLIVCLKEDCEYISIDVCRNTELYHWEEATKENYTEACKLCLKLFKGYKEDE